ncbi:MAG: hypothetical protein JNM19_02565 [Chitinophagaceae bacterium]|nr:hypothetical protein [Chitinophagaceae bacterium]
MRRSTPILVLTFSFLFTSVASYSQNKTGELEAVKELAKANHCAGYYVYKQKGYRVNQQLADKIVRHQYNADFELTGSYESPTIDYTINLDFIGTPVFSADLQLGNSVYEVYIDKKRVWVVAPDFVAKKDSIVFKLGRGDHEPDERRLAVIPHKDGLRIITFSNKRDKLFLYNWRGEGLIDTTVFSLPESPMTPEEIKKYSKDVKVKYRPALQDLVVTKANSNTVLAYPGTNYLYYDDDKIWLLLQTYLGTGIHVLTLDIKSGAVTTSNFFINDLFKNFHAKADNYRTPYALIWKNHLIIRNSSYYFFQYLFYDLATNKLVKEYTATADESFMKLVNSDLNQKGTWLAGGDEKKLNNEKAYLRKLSSGDGFICLSGETIDSITITNGSVKDIKGLAGSMVAIGTAFIGAALNLTIGNIQIIPYLQTFQKKMVYFHTTFSRGSFDISPSASTTTMLDKLLENFERKDLKSKSSFFITTDSKNIMAVFNADTGKFELYTLDE